MSSSKYSTKPAFLNRRWSMSLVDQAQTRLSGWLKRRGPVHPPLTLRYRQIYILPTRFGWMVGLLLFAMLLGSLNFNNNLGLFTTFLVAGIGLLSMHIAHRNLDGVRVADCRPGQAFAGEPLELAITLMDTRDRKRRGLTVQSKGLPAVSGVDIAADSSAETRLSISTLRRGWMEISRIRLRTRHPIGWFEAWSWFWPEHKVLVWPKPADHAPPLLRAGKSDSRNRAGDESDEFHGLRDWREGDPLHRIAWKASQRHQNLLARQFTRPERERIILRLADAPGRSIEDRISVLARWVLEADRNDFEYGMDLGTTPIQPALGPAHRVRCLNALAELP